MGEHLPTSNKPEIIREPGVIGGAEKFISQANFHVPVQGEFNSTHGLISEGEVRVLRPGAGRMQVKGRGNSTSAASDIRRDAVSERCLENKIPQQGHLIKIGAIGN